MDVDRKIKFEKMAKERHITWVFAQGSLPQFIGKVNWLIKSGKDHIFLRLGLLRSPYSAQKNVAYARTLYNSRSAPTLCVIPFELILK
jgi:hypothetical protein